MSDQNMEFGVVDPFAYLQECKEILNSRHNLTAAEASQALPALAMVTGGGDLSIDLSPTDLLPKRGPLKPEAIDAFVQLSGLEVVIPEPPDTPHSEFRRTDYGQEKMSITGTVVRDLRFITPSRRPAFHMLARNPGYGFLPRDFDEVLSLHKQAGNITTELRYKATHPGTAEYDVLGDVWRHLVVPRKGSITWLEPSTASPAFGLNYELLPRPKQETYVYYTDTSEVAIELPKNFDPASRLINGEWIHDPNDSSIGPTAVITDQNELTINGQPISLTARQVNLYNAFLVSSNRVVSKATCQKFGFESWRTKLNKDVFNDCARELMQLLNAASDESEPLITRFRAQNQPGTPYVYQLNPTVRHIDERTQV